MVFFFKKKYIIKLLFMFCILKMKSKWEEKILKVIEKLEKKIKRIENKYCCGISSIHDNFLYKGKKWFIHYIIDTSNSYFMIDSLDSDETLEIKVLKNNRIAIIKTFIKSDYTKEKENLVRLRSMINNNFSEFELDLEDIEFVYYN